jgi:fluoride exporter
MKQALYVGLAGAIGAICRVGIGEMLNGSPIATLSANFLGTFILCLLSAGVIQQLTTDKKLQTAVTTGLLGSFTTFSAFSMDTVSFFQNGQVMLGCLYVFVSIFVGLVLGMLGLRVGRKLVKT